MKMPLTSPTSAACKPVFNEKPSHFFTFRQWSNPGLLPWLRNRGSIEQEFHFDTVFQAALLQATQSKGLFFPPCQLPVRVRKFWGPIVFYKFWFRCDHLRSPSGFGFLFLGHVPINSYMTPWKPPELKWKKHLPRMVQNNFHVRNWTFTFQHNILSQRMLKKYK